MNDPKIIVALDFPSASQAHTVAMRLDPELCKVKVGLELFISAGPDYVRALNERGFDVFLDLKLHDIPNTVGRSIASIRELNVWGTTVHATNGIDSLLEAANCNIGSQHSGVGLGMKLFAVTALTSLNDTQWDEIGMNQNIERSVPILASLACEAGFDGCVCSAHEAERMKTEFPSMATLCPGIRPKGAPNYDQERVVTPTRAIESGVDYMVIGRPITESSDPSRALRLIAEEIDRASK